MKKQSSLEKGGKILTNMKFIGFPAISIEDGRSVTKPIDLGLFATNFSLGVFICILTIRNKANILTDQPEIADYGNFVILIASNLTALSSVIFGFILRHNIWKIAVNIYKVELRVSWLPKLLRTDFHLKLSVQKHRLCC